MADLSHLVNTSRESGYEYGNLLPFRKPVAGGSAEWNLGYSNLIKGIADAFAAPGEALQGETSPEAAVNFALNFTGGSLVPKAPPGSVGMMRTLRSHNLSEAEARTLGDAKELYSQGYYPASIYSRTGGAYMDAGGEPFLPINPHSVKLNPNRYFEAFGAGPVPLEDVVTVPGFAEAYPERAKTLMLDVKKESGGGSLGSYDRDTNTVSLYPLNQQETPTLGHMIAGVLGESDLPRNHKQTLVHELAHAGQNYGGLTPGTNPFAFTVPGFNFGTLEKKAGGKPWEWERGQSGYEKLLDLLRIPNNKHSYASSGIPGGPVQNALDAALNPDFLTMLGPEERVLLAQGMLDNRGRQMYSPTDFQHALYLRAGGEQVSRQFENMLELTPLEADTMYVAPRVPLNRQLVTAPGTSFSGNTLTPEQANIVLGLAGHFDQRGRLKK